MTTPTFFKSKKFLIPALVLGLLTLGYFSWANYSKNNSVQPLVADADHDVAVLEECNLAVRFDKNKYSLKLKMSKNYNGKDVFSILLNEGKFIYDFSLISCEPYQGQPQHDPDISTYKSKLFKNLLDGVDRFTMNRLNINSSDCLGVSYTVIHKNNFYNFNDFISPVSLECAFFVDWTNFIGLFRTYNQGSLQIQFNSLAPSTPSVKL